MSKQFDIRSISPQIRLWNDYFVGEDISESLLAVETNKNIDEIAGSFTIQLKPNSGVFGKTTDWWYDRFDPQDVIGITINSAGNLDEKGKDKGAQYLGLVDIVNKHNNYSQENPMRVTTISGRDFGALLLDDDLIYVKEIFLEVGADGKPIPYKEGGENLRVAKIYTDIESEIAGALCNRHPCFTPGCLVGIGSSFDTKGTFSFKDAPITDAAKFIIQNASSIRNLVYKIVPKSGVEKTLVRDMLNLSDYVFQRPNYVCTPNPNLSTFQGNLLNFIRDVLDSDFNEIFIDTKDGVSYLRIRPKPFDRVGDTVNDNVIDKNDPFCWENIKTFVSDKEYHIIEEHEIVEINLNRNKQNIYSVFRANPASLNDLDEEFGFIMKRATIDLYNLIRYGLKKLEADIYTTIKGNNDIIIDQVIMECRDRLKNWNIYKPIFEEGQIVIKGREDIHIGDKIYLPWYKREYISKELSYLIEDCTAGEGFEFYCIGTKQKWELEKNYLTTLTLARGCNMKLLQAYIAERNRILESMAGNVDKYYQLMESYKEE